MRVGPGEPAVERWDVVPIGALVDSVLGPQSPPTELPQIVAVDGRSGGGKSTLAAQLQRHIANAVIIHTDDVAWHHSFFDWCDLLIDGVLRPARANRKVDFRPPAWVRRGRQGSISVGEACEVIILEGVGASRREIWPWLTASIWIQSDMDAAERRGLARDGDTAEAQRFWREWMREENAFLELQQPWLRAAAIVNGTPSMAYDPEWEVVVAA